MCLQICLLFLELGTFFCHLAVNFSSLNVKSSISSLCLLSTDLICDSVVFCNFCFSLALLLLRCFIAVSNLPLSSFRSVDIFSFKSSRCLILLLEIIFSFSYKEFNSWYDSSFFLTSVLSSSTILLNFLASSV